MKQSPGFCVAFGALAMVASAWASDVPPSDTVGDPGTEPAKYGGFVFSGLADGYFTLNLNHPSDGANELQNFDLKWGQPEFSLVKVAVDKSDQVVGFHVDAGLGETMRLIHANDPAAMEHPAFRYIEQMYLIAKPRHVHGIEVDFGEFVTSAGAETIESNANWNYSRSLLFAYAVPYYHFGVRSTLPVTKTLTVGIQVVNGWNTLWGNNDMRNIGVTAAWTKPRYTWSANYYEGPSHVGNSDGRRDLIDTTLLLTPNGRISLYVNGDYGRDKRVADPGYQTWYGLAGAARIRIASRIALSPRLEIFNDRNGFTTGTAQTVKEATLTGEYKYDAHWTARLEYRHDNSNRMFFNRGADLTTATLGIMYAFGPI
jgi:hypothetical protein